MNTPSENITLKKIYLRNKQRAKDRMVNLSYEAKVILERYFHQYSPQTYLFEGAKAATPYIATSVSHIIKSAAKKHRLAKSNTIHTTGTALQRISWIEVSLYPKFKNY